MISSDPINSTRLDDKSEGTILALRNSAIAHGDAASAAAMQAILDERAGALKQPTALRRRKR